MTKGTQLWPNQRMRDFFLAHIRRETSLNDGEAAHLTDALLKAVNRMLVWDMPAAAASVPVPSPAPTKTGAKATELKTADSKTGELKKTSASAATSPSQPSSNARGAKSGAAAPSNFDPYAFSATVVLAKTGRDGLAKKLLDIKTADQLKAFAEAQHLGLDRKLSRIDDLRKAILAAAEQRLADRKAAAS